MSFAFNNEILLPGLGNLVSAGVGAMMLRWLFGLFGKRPEAPQAIRHLPTSGHLPEFWRGGAPDLSLLKTASLPALTEMCEGIWSSYLGEDDDDEATITRDGEVHQAVLSELSTRGPECVDWAIRQLDHRAYEAREDCARLLKAIAESHGLGVHLERAVSALEELALRPVVEDNKEAVAATEALYALDVIDGEACVRAARGVLTSPDWDADDNQWMAAELIERHTGQSFMTSSDPVAAAKSWIAANP